MPEITDSIIYIVLSVILLIGFIVVYAEYKSYDTKYKFALKYFDTIKKYIESQGEDNSSYTWLTSKSSKIQSEMGIFGIVSYKPAGANYIHSNYQLIVNGLSELRQYFQDTYIFSRLANEMSATLQEALIRYIGHIEDKLGEKKNNLFNPVIIFREGVRYILSVPLKILGWFGIVSMHSIYQITTSVIFKTISGITAFITFIATLMSLVLGWSDFIKIISGS